jgi:hypothetical protein
MPARPIVFTSDATEVFPHRGEGRIRTLPVLHERHASVRAAVKRVALSQLEAGGAAAVAINAIARELGVSGPAL